MSIGNRIFTDYRRPAPELVQQFAGLPSGNINDEMNRLFCMHDYIQLLNPEKARPLLGAAFTCRVSIGDNLFMHQALDLIRPGDVLVVDAGSGCNRSIAGEIMLRFLNDLGCAGVIVDGCLRDLDGIETLEMPVYAKGITPQGPWKNGPGEIGVPVACGGQVVFPGDILVGDKDGVVVVRPQVAETVAKASRKKKASEDETFRLMREDFEAYKQDHQRSTEKRMDGKKTEWLKAYTDVYGE